MGVLWTRIELRSDVPVVGRGGLPVGSILDRLKAGDEPAESVSLEPGTISSPSSATPRWGGEPGRPSLVQESPARGPLAHRARGNGLEEPPAACAAAGTACARGRPPPDPRLLGGQPRGRPAGRRPGRASRLGLLARHRPSPRARRRQRGLLVPPRRPASSLRVTGEGSRSTPRGARRRSLDATTHVGRRLEPVCVC